MNNFRILMAITMGLLIASLSIWLYKAFHPKELAVAPDIEMIQNCERMLVTVHIFNPDHKAMHVGYNVYVDLNNNSLLDSTDQLVYSEPKRTIIPGTEYKGMDIGPQFKYKGYSFIVKATTDDVIAYYASIPCDSDSTPTK
jgi:hypothetical protein